MHLHLYKNISISNQTTRKFRFRTEYGNSGILLKEVQRLIAFPICKLFGQSQQYLSLTGWCLVCRHSSLPLDVMVSSYYLKPLVWPLILAKLPYLVLTCNNLKMCRFGMHDKNFKNKNVYGKIASKTSHQKQHTKLTTNKMVNDNIHNFRA